MPVTLIAADKIRAYRATHYRLGHTAQDIVLAPGLRSNRLFELFSANGVECGAFLTAYNPRGNQKSVTENEQAHALLAAALTERSLVSIEGSGSEPGSDWPAEKSYFAFGLSRDKAIGFGHKFDQDAIVWVGKHAVPELVLLR